MRFLHCTVGSLVLALASTAVAQEPSQARPPEPAEVTQFTVFLKGTPVGTVEVSVERGPSGITISGTSRLGPPLSLVVRNVEIRYDPDWKPLAYTLDSAIRNLVLRVRTKFAGGTATSDVTQVDKSLKKTDAVALDTIVLPSAFYGAYEALAARLASAASGTELRGYIVPQAEVAIKVTAVTEERIEAPGRSVATHHYLISMAMPDGPTDIDLWNDPAGRLVRLSVPAQSLDVVRADVATVAARREVAVRPGDEIVRIPGNGFVLGATLSRPPGSAKSGAAKLPTVVLVGSSGSADRNETVSRVPIFAQLAGSLADAGFLVARYDKRGTGESGGRIETATISDYADDADAVVRCLEKRKDVDKKRIAMVANDDGVWTALLAASRSGRVAALGLIGGAGSTGAQVTLAQQQRALGRMSISDAEKLARVELQQKIQKAVVSGRGWEGVPSEMRKQADTPWFQSFLLFDPAKVVPRTRQPMLLLRGALDTQVSMADHEKLVALARARKDPAGKAVQAATLAGLNHLLVPATTGEVDEYASLEDRTVGGELTSTLVTWLKATFAAVERK